MAVYLDGVSGVPVIKSANRAPCPDRRNVTTPDRNVAGNIAIQEFYKKRPRSATTAQVRGHAWDIFT